MIGNQIPDNSLNTALNFSLSTITTELARRAWMEAKIALTNAENAAKVEKKDLNFVKRILRSGGEKLITGYSTETLKEAQRIKEEQLNSVKGVPVISSLTGGIKKKITRGKKKSKKKRTKIKKRKEKKVRTNNKRITKKR